MGSQLLRRQVWILRITHPELRLGRETRVRRSENQRCCCLATICGDGTVRRRQRVSSMFPLPSLSSWRKPRFVPDDHCMTESPFAGVAAAFTPCGRVKQRKLCSFCDLCPILAGNERTVSGAGNNRVEYEVCFWRWLPFHQVGRGRQVPGSHASRAQSDM